VRLSLCVLGVDIASSRIQASSRFDPFAQTFLSLFVTYRLAAIETRPSIVRQAFP
jgi:hypothetical protein